MGAMVQSAVKRPGQVHQVPVDPGRHHVPAAGQLQSRKGLGYRRARLQGGGGTLIQGNVDHAYLNKKGISGVLRRLPRCRRILNYVTYD